MPSAESLEELRLILQKETGRKVTLEEAKKTANWLLRFYRHLAPREINLTSTK